MSEQLKERYYVTPSNLASYFGCGFNTPEEQYLIDTGQEPAVFDDDSMDRMALGNILENSVIDYFQDHVFKTPITDRNEELKIGFDGKIHYKIDGIIHLDGKPAIFENKISNSKSYKFTENYGYYIQVQSYLLCEGLDKAVLAGLYQGKPIYKIIERNEEVIEDIATMTNFIVDALNGIVDFYEDYPVDLLSKYSKEKIYEPIEDLSLSTKTYLYELAKLNKEKNEIDRAIKDLKKKHENDFEISEGVYEDENISVKVTKWYKKGGIDVDAIMNDHPEIDYAKYELPENEYTKMTLKLK